MAEKPAEQTPIEWEWTDGVAAKVELKNEAGAIIDTVMVPYDPDNQPSEDEITKQAWQMHTVTEHIRSRISEKDVKSLAESLRTGEYGSWIHSMLEDYIETLKVPVTSYDDSYKDADEVEETRHEIEAIVREGRSDLIDAFMGGPGVWEEISRDMLTHAWNWAYDELHLEDPSSEELTDEEFNKELSQRYKERPYLYQSIMQLTPAWGQFILEQIADTLSRKHPEPEKSISDQLENAAREQIQKRRKLSDLPVMANAFHNGWGRVSSVALVHGSLPHLMTPWSGDHSVWPEQRFLWDGGDSWFRLTFHENPAGGTDKQRAAAWELASSLNQWVGHVAVAIALIYQRNKTHGGRVVVSTNRILKELGKGGSKQGYRARERPLVNDAMYALSQLVIQDLRYLHRASRKHKPEPRNAPTRHWLTYDILDRSGDDITYDVWLGEPLLQMVADFPGQVAHILEGSIGPDGRNPYRATLSLIIPIKARSHQKHFTEHGVKVRDILTMAGIDVDTISPKSRTRWRKDTLPKLLDSLDCLEWKWKTPPQTKWTQWLDNRALLYVKREAAGPASVEDEREEPTDEAKIAVGWLSQ